MTLLENARDPRQTAGPRALSIKLRFVPEVLTGSHKRLVRRPPKMGAFHNTASNTRRIQQATGNQVFYGSRPTNRRVVPFQGTERSFAKLLDVLH